MRYPRFTAAVLAAALAAAAACRSAAPAPLAASSPDALGLAGEGAYAAYLASLPRRFRMRHQVESSFQGRTETIEGFLVVAWPDRFFVHARSPLGPALFDVKSVPPAPLEVAAHLQELEDERFARYLARDVRRIYLDLCPAGTPVAAAGGDAFVVRCALAAGGETPGAVDAPDDAVELRLGAGGELWEKVFYRGGARTATVRYEDTRPASGARVAHHIELSHASLPYRLRVVLVALDLDFDTSRVLGGGTP